VTSAEYEDLVQIGLSSLIIALHSYGFKGAFFSYWQIIAKNNMKDQIKAFSLAVFGQTGLYKKRDEGLTLDEEEAIFACGENVNDDVSNNILIERIMDIISNYKSYSLNKEGCDMFRLYYFYELSFKEIATKYEKKYCTVRNKILTTKAKIEFILFNSKE